MSVDFQTMARFVHVLLFTLSNVKLTKVVNLQLVYNVYAHKIFLIFFSKFPTNSVVTKILPLA